MHSTEDQRLGRFYTPDSLAAFVLALALEGRRAHRLWDPTCGDGSFLRAASGRATQLVGTDLDEVAVRTLAAQLPEAHLTVTELFSVERAELGTFDAIVGNPPFLRTERVPPSQRAHMRARVTEATGVSIPGSVDTSLLALAWCCRFLRPGGRLAFVLPATALDVASGAGLRRWIATHHHVQWVVDSQVEPWFLNAAVNTVVVLVEAAPPGPTRFVRLRAPVCAQLGLDLLEDTVREVRTLPPSALETPRWSPLLRAPEVWFELLEAAGDRLVSLGQRLRLAYGTKPGISAFFAPRPPPDVEEHHLRPFLRTLRHQSRYRVLPEHTEDRLFVVPPGEALGPRAAAWVAEGAERTSRRGVPYPEVPSVKGNTPWWRLPEPRSGPVLLPQFRAARHHVLDNPEQLPVNNSAWHGTWHTPSHHGVGVGLLNASLMALGAEVLGRTNLGEGLLTLYGPELRALPMPDPGLYEGDAADAVRCAWKEMAGRDVLPFAEEARREDRRRLDTATLRGLGLPGELAEPIASAAVALLHTRERLATERRARLASTP
ncbi:MAG: N-6 DNA methylase [Deltaproteobacteria bacterium]|nr:N-6 DNA methylase [Deltaproteobacteria bacterium]